MGLEEDMCLWTLFAAGLCYCYCSKLLLFLKQVLCKWMKSLLLWYFRKSCYSKKIIKLSTVRITHWLNLVASYPKREICGSLLLYINKTSLNWKQVVAGTIIICSHFNLPFAVILNLPISSWSLLSSINMSSLNCRQIAAGAHGFETHSLKSTSQTSPAKPGAQEHSKVWNKSVTCVVTRVT